MTGLQLILDPCCGSRMFWFDRENPQVVFGDLRETVQTLCDGRVLRVEPDVKLDFRALPFGESSFKLVVFDPPHLVRAGPKSWLASKYGKLKDDWRNDLRKGFAECFRVLAEDGVLVFKWNETQIAVREVLELTTIRPLFGNTTGRKSGTHWMVFMKPRTSARGAVASGDGPTGPARKASEPDEQTPSLVSLQVSLPEGQDTSKGEQQ